ncbi:MAG: hypothetical protein ACU0DK_03010 [Pseudooceanicola sp.]
MLNELRYDFDMVPVIPGHMRQSFRKRGVADARLDEKVALFRDARTVLALKSCDAEVRDLFTASGFGLTPSENRLYRHGRFAPEDEDARLALLKRLLDLLKERRRTVLTCNWGHFSMQEFLDAAGMARPARRGAGDNVVSLPDREIWRRAKPRHPRVPSR